MHVISSYRGNRPTHTHTHTHKHIQTDRTDYIALRRSLARNVTRPGQAEIEYGGSNRHYQRWERMETSESINARFTMLK